MKKIIAAICLLATTSLWAEVVTLAWDSVSDSTVVGYNFYVKSTSWDTWEKDNSAAITDTTWSIDIGNRTGVVEFYVTSTDKWKRESEPSNIVSIQRPLSSPADLKIKKVEIDFMNSGN
jgi:hypothetical protein